MLRIREYQDGNAAQWDAYVRRSPESHFGQLIAWRNLVAASFRVWARYWFAEDEQGVRGILPLFQTAGNNARLFSPPGGLLADDETVAAALLEPARLLLQRDRLAYIELRDQKRRWPGLKTNEEHFTLVLDLEQTVEAQWDAFDAKLRNQVRKGQKSGFEIHWGRDHVNEFYRVLLENLRDLGTPIHNLSYYQRVLNCFGDAANVLVISHENRPAGAMFMVVHRDTMCDPWASSLRRYFKLCANEALYWEAIQQAIRGGLRHFDFGRSQWDSGTFRFKRNWGAQPVPLYYQYILGRAGRVPTLADQQQHYALAVRLWQRLPLPMAGFLGEFVRRRFPEVL